MDFVYYVFVDDSGDEIVKKGGRKSGRIMRPPFQIELLYFAITCTIQEYSSKD